MYLSWGFDGSAPGGRRTKRWKSFEHRRRLLICHHKQSLGNAMAKLVVGVRCLSLAGLVLIGANTTLAQEPPGEVPSRPTEAPGDDMRSDNPLLGHQTLVGLGSFLFQDAERFGSGFDCRVTFDIAQTGVFDDIRDVDCRPDLGWRIDRALNVARRDPVVIDGLAHRVESARVRLLYDGPAASNQELRYDVLDRGRVVRPQPPTPEPEPDASPAPLRETLPATPEAPIVSSEAPQGRTIGITEEDLAHAADLAGRGPMSRMYGTRVSSALGSACDSSRSEDVLVVHRRSIDFHPRGGSDWTKGQLGFSYRYTHPGAPVSRTYSVPIAEIGRIVEADGQRYIVCRSEAGACIVDGSGAPVGPALELRCPQPIDGLRNIQAMRVIAALPVRAVGDSVSGAAEIVPPEGGEPVSVAVRSANEGEFVLMILGRTSLLVRVEPADLTASLDPGGLLTLTCGADKGRCFRHQRQRQGLTDEMILRGDLELLRAMEGLVAGEAPLTELLAERPFPFERYGLD